LKDNAKMKHPTQKCNKTHPSLNLKVHNMSDELKL